jgi:hypothetical protein
MREIAQRNARARALLRRPLAGPVAEAALEERYARRLLTALGGERQGGPHFVFGASGLTLGELTAGREDGVEWEIGASAHPPGYPPELVTAVITTVRTDLDAFGQAEQAVLENHGYLLADAAARGQGMTVAGGIDTEPPEPPHPEWMSEERVRTALATSSRRTPLGRLRPGREKRPEPLPQEASAELTVLLERNRPLLHYDSLETCRADSAAMICSLVAPGRCNSLHRAAGARLASAPPRGDEARLDLDYLRDVAYRDGQAVEPGDYLDECGGSHASDALLLRRARGDGRRRLRAGVPRQQPQWRDPAAMHREARPWHEARPPGALEAPPQPRLQIQRDGDLAIVSYRFGERVPEAGEPARMVAAPMPARGDEEPCSSDWFPVEGRQGSFAVRLPAGRTWTGIRASVASERGICGETVTARFA